MQASLKRHIFFSSLGKKSRQFVCFSWSGNLYEFLCLCFGLGPALQIFTKLLKVPITILHRTKIKIIIYLDDMLLIGHSLEEILLCQNLSATPRICHKLGNICVGTSARNIIFGLDNQLCQSIISLNKTKMQKVISECQNLLNNPQTSILELTKLIGLLTSAIQTDLPSRLNCRLLQMHNYHLYPKTFLI